MLPVHVPGLVHIAVHDHDHGPTAAVLQGGLM